MKKGHAKSVSAPVTPKIVSVQKNAHSFTTKKSADWEISNDYQYAVNYDYDSSDNCISNTQVRDINAETMARHILWQKPTKFKIDAAVRPFFDYALNRIITHSGALAPGNWRVEIRSGYYGPEIGGVCLADAVQKVVVANLEKLVQDLTPKNCVETALIAEYGYLLDGLAPLAWRIVSVTPDLVKMPMSEQYARTNASVIEQYKQNRDWKHPIAVVLPDGAFYRLIDGRHRFIAKKNKKSIPVIIGE